MPTEKPRITITVTDEERNQINEFWHRNQLKNQTQAIVSLLKLGLKEVDEGRVSQGDLVIRDAVEDQMIELFAMLDDKDRADLYHHGQLMLLQDKYK